MEEKEKQTPLDMEFPNNLFTMMNSYVQRGVPIPTIIMHVEMAKYQALNVFFNHKPVHAEPPKPKTKKKGKKK